MVLSALTAPIYMIGNTRAVFEILMGKDAGWVSQNRDADGLDIADARVAFRNEFFAGMFFLVPLAMRPDLLMWIWPIFVPMLFAPRIAAWTSSRAAGQKAFNAGLLITPEERAAMAVEAVEPHHGGEVVPMPVRAANPALMAAE